MSLRGWVAYIIHRLIDWISKALAWFGYRLHPMARPEKYDLTIHRNIPYLDSGNRAHRLDVYRPKSDHPLPTLMYVHGGGFNMCSKDLHRIFAMALAIRKFVVFNINYRLAPLPPYPAALEDAAAALEWVADHAAEYGADPSRIVIAGESAGGNLVASLGYIAMHRREEPFARRLFERNVPLKGVVPIYGIHDLHDIPRYWRKPGKERRMPWFIKAELKWCAYSYVRENPESAPLAHPLRLYSVPASNGSRPMPPFFITAGTADPLLADSKRLHEILQGRGVPSELHVYPGEIHGFNAMLWRPNAKAMWNALYAYLDRVVGERAAAAEADSLKSA